MGKSSGKSTSDLPASATANTAILRTTTAEHAPSDDCSFEVSEVLSRSLSPALIGLKAKNTNATNDAIGFVDEPKPERVIGDAPTTCSLVGDLVPLLAELVEEIPVGSAVAEPLSRGKRRTFGLDARAIERWLSETTLLPVDRQLLDQVQVEPQILVLVLEFIDLMPDRSASTP